MQSVSVVAKLLLIDLAFNNVCFRRAFDIVNVLGNPSDIRSWGIFGLPNDSCALQCALIIK